MNNISMGKSRRTGPESKCQYIKSIAIKSLPTWWTRLRNSQSVRYYSGYLLSSNNPVGKLSDRSSGNNLIDRALKRVILRVPNRRGRCDAKNWTTISVCCCKTSEAVRKTKGFLMNTNRRYKHINFSYPLLAVTKQTPGFVLIRQYPSAAWTATVSCLVSTKRIPMDSQPIKNASRWPPWSPNATSTPSCFSDWASKSPPVSSLLDGTSRAKLAIVIYEMLYNKLSG